MSNPIFYATDLALQTFTWSAGEDTAYPAVNLNNYLAAIPSKSNATTKDQRIYVDFVTAKACDFVIIDTHNFSSLNCSSVGVECADASDFTTGYISLGSLTLGTDPIIFSFGSQTKRYFGLKFNRTIALSAKPSIGNLFFDSAIAFTYNYDSDAELGNKKFSTNMKESLDGTLRTSRQVEGRKRQEFTFSLITNTEVTNFQTLMDRVKGKSNPFYFKNDADLTDYCHFEEDYIPAKGKRANVNDLVRLKMMKQLIG